jgi:DNA repair exonuclease SbcCD ATPase subunit
MFKDIAPQQVQHDSGYIVQSGGRYSLQYIDGDLLAEIEGDRGPSVIGIFPRSMVVRQGGVEKIRVPNEKQLIIDRITSALAHWGMKYEIYER